MVRWHHRVNGHEFEQTLGDGEGQGSLELLRSMGKSRVWFRGAKVQGLPSSWFTLPEMLYQTGPLTAGP